MSIWNETSVSDSKWCPFLVSESTNGSSKRQYFNTHCCKGDCMAWKNGACSRLNQRSTSKEKN